MPGTLLRLAAFTTDPAGGNPAGVWIGATLPPDEEMQRIAAEVGYSETAFLVPDGSGVAGGSASGTSALSPRSRSAGTRRSRAASRWPIAAWLPRQTAPVTRHVCPS